MKSLNFSSRQGWIPDRIVMHITEGNYNGAVSWLCNPLSKASAHFVTARDGRYVQIIDLDKMSWANGTSSNSKSNVYYGTSKLDFVKERKVNANLYTISIENEGFSNSTGGTLTEKQYQSVLKICKELILAYPSIKIDRQHIIGHNEISPIAKPNCPGKKFPFERLINDLKEWEDERMFKELIEKFGEENVRRALEKLINAANDDGLPSDWAVKEYEEAKDLKITDGSNPEMFATRQEVAIMIKRALKG